MKFIYFLLTVLLLGAKLTLAQNERFTASVDKNPVGTGDIFTVTFSVNGNGSRFSPPDFRDFQLAGGPNESTSMESVNGNTTVSTAYSYELLAVKEGEFIIGPATITVDGRRLSTNAVKIKVVKGRSAPQNRQAQAPQDNQTDGGDVQDISKLLFIKAVVDKTTVYKGQQISLTYRLYSRVDIEQNQPTIVPELNGFWSEDIKPKQQQIPMHQEIYNGRQYQVADIRKTVLFPEHEGNLTIDPFGMAFIVRVRAPSNDIMEQFFGNYKEERYEAKSTPVTIHVKPLPEAGKPAGFTGAVGNFMVEATVDKTGLKANDALNYKVKVTGSGNLKLLKTLNVNFPVDFEKYDPKITDTITEGEGGTSGSRFYNYLLIPRHQGEFSIDPLKFSYFNPIAGKYVTVTSKGFHISVAKGSAENNVTSFSGPVKQDVKMLNKDIRYIKTDDSPGSKGDDFFGSGTYYSLLAAGPLLCIGGLVYRNRMRTYGSDMVKVKSDKAAKIAARHLASAQKQLVANNSKVFYEDLAIGLYGYLSDKLNLPYANLDKENIAGELKAKKVNDTTITRLTDTLDLCEMARYAPVTHIAQQDVFEKAKNIINAIENEL